MRADLRNKLPSQQLRSGLGDAVEYVPVGLLEHDCWVHGLTAGRNVVLLRAFWMSDWQGGLASKL